MVGIPSVSGEHFWNHHVGTFLERTFQKATDSSSSSWVHQRNRPIVRKIKHQSEYFIQKHLMAQVCSLWFYDIETWNHTLYFTSRCIMKLPWPTSQRWKIPYPMNCGLIQSPESTPELHNALDPEIYVYIYTGIYKYIYIYIYIYIYMSINNNGPIYLFPILKLILYQWDWKRDG